MKLIFLIILLCGITSKPVRTSNSMKVKTACVRHQKAAIIKATSSKLDIIPAGLLFQF